MRPTTVQQLIADLQTRITDGTYNLDRILLVTIWQASDVNVPPERWSEFCNLWQAGSPYHELALEEQTSLLNWGVADMS